MADRENVISCLEQCLDDSIAAVVPADTVRDALTLLEAQEPRTCSECRHYDINAFTDMGGKCRNSRSCHYCYGCDKSFGCNAWEGGGEVGMTVKEAILTLNANVVIACERAGFSSATVKMIEDALDTIEDALKAQEPRILTVSEIGALANGDVVWVEFTDGRLLPMIVEDGCLMRWRFMWRICEDAFYDEDYKARAWTSRPTDAQREENPWPDA